MGLKSFKDLNRNEEENKNDDKEYLFPETLKKFKEILRNDQQNESIDFDSLLLESEEIANQAKHELTEEEEKAINTIVDVFNKEYKEQGKTLADFEYDIVYEGKLGQVLGGLSGLALGKTVGKMLGSVLGLEEDGLLYDLFTSRLFGASLGAALGKRI